MTGFRPSRRHVIAAAALTALPFPVAASGLPLKITEMAALRTSAGALAASGGYRENGAISPNGQLIALAPDNIMAVFDSTGAQVDTVSGSAERDYTAQFSPDSRALVVGSYRTVRLYDLAARRELWRARFDPVVLWDPWTISYRPGHAQLAVTGSNDVALLLDASNGRVVREFRGHSEMICDHAFTSDGARLITGPDEAGLVQVLDVETGEVLQRFNVALGIWGAVSRDGVHFITTRTRGFVDVWSIASGARVRSFAAPFNGTMRLGAAGRLRGALAGADGNWVIVAAERTNQIQVFDWTNGDLLLNAPVEGGGPTALAVFGDGRSILYGDPARIWALEQA